MSTLVYQGLQSCLDPQLKETTTLRLKLAAPKSMGIIGVPTNSNKEVTEDCHNDNATNKFTSNPDLGGWNILQSLATSPQNPKNAMDIATSSLRLSQKSLEICTENLGSETGSDDTSESRIFSFSPTSLPEKMHSSRLFSSAKKVNSSRLFSSAKKVMNSRSFPPPLTTRCGSSSIQVRPHREGGRLIMEAVEAPSTRTYFETERSDGRLKLRLVDNCDEFVCDKQVTSSLENEESNESDNDNEEFENEENDFEGKLRKNEEENGACSKIVGENGAYMKKDMDGKRKDVGPEMEKEKFQRLSRCKEGGHGSDNGLCKWEPFWVATS